MRKIKRLWFWNSWIFFSLLQLVCLNMGIICIEEVFKANVTCEIERVSFIRITEVAPVMSYTFTVLRNTAVTTVQLWWYLSNFSRNWNKSLSDQLFFSITDFVESSNLCKMQWELNINWFATFLIFFCMPFFLPRKTFAPSDIMPIVSGKSELSSTMWEWELSSLIEEFNFQIYVLWIRS